MRIKLIVASVSITRAPTCNVRPVHAHLDVIHDADKRARSTVAYHNHLFVAQFFVRRRSQGLISDAEKLYAHICWGDRIFHELFRKECIKIIVHLLLSSVDHGKVTFMASRHSIGGARSLDTPQCDEAILLFSVKPMHKHPLLCPLFANSPLVYEMTAVKLHSVMLSCGTLHSGGWLATLDDVVCYVFIP
jgi:hypothetical protein